MRKSNMETSQIKEKFPKLINGSTYCIILYNTVGIIYIAS